jgi:hypothetical protein
MSVVPSVALNAKTPERIPLVPGVLIFPGGRTVPSLSSRAK